jgi:hypothetical protein
LGLVGRHLERLDAVIASLTGDCTAYVLDVRDADAMQQAAQDFLQKYGAPDIVIANAGISRGTLTEFAEDLSAFRAIMDTNVLGCQSASKSFQVTASNTFQLVSRFLMISYAV